MFKAIITAGILTVAITGSVSAQDSTMKCDEASMMKMETDAGAMTDATKKEMAMKEMAMAKEAMAAKDMDKCKTHMDNAMKSAM